MNLRPTRSARKGFPPVFFFVFGVLFALAALFWLSRTSVVSANGSDINLFLTTYPNVAGSRIDPSSNCVMCHTTSIPNLNPYGAAYKTAGRGLASSLHSIESADSDGDGFSNIVEITAFFFPGNPADHPVASATPTATRVPPTPTNTRVAPSPTNTGVAPSPTNTRVAPSPTSVAPSPTGVAPSPTGVAPSPTGVGPTATKPAVSRTPRVTATRSSKTTRTRTARRTPSVSPTVVCTPDFEDDNSDSEDVNSQGAHNGQSDDEPHGCITATPGYGDDGGSSRGGHAGDDWFTQLEQTISRWFRGGD